MPVVPFETLPSEARVWVFGAQASIEGEAETRMLTAVDEFLADWRAHGDPLVVGRNWDERRFLTIGVDQSGSHASGCSIDGLFRTLKTLEPEIGSTMVDRSLVFYRGRQGEIRAVSRAGFEQAAASGAVDGTTEVFDPTVTTIGEWRSHFRASAAQSWHSGLLPSTSR